MPIPAYAHTLCCYKQKRRYSCLCSVWLPSKNDAESHFSKLSLAELPRVLELTFQEPYVWFEHMLLFCCMLWEVCIGGHRKSCISICRITFLKGKNMYDQPLSPEFWGMMQKEHIQQDERHMSFRQALRGNMEQLLIRQTCLSVLGSKGQNGVHSTHHFLL